MTPWKVCPVVPGPVLTAPELDFIPFDCNHQTAGYLYGYDFEWDGALLLERFDSVNKNAGCSVGTTMLVLVDEVMCCVEYIGNMNDVMYFAILLTGFGSGLFPM